VGHFQVRNRGTAGGSVAHADPAGEYPAAALTLDATFEAASVGGVRSIPAAEFFTGTWTTQLADDELLTAVTFPVWQGRTGFAVEELARRHGDFAVAGAMVGVEVGDDGTVSHCAIGLFGVAPTPERAAAAENAAKGAGVHDVSAEELGTHAVSTLRRVTSDLHASADYRTHVAAVMVARAWRRAVSEVNSD